MFTSILRHSIIRSRYFLIGVVFLLLAPLANAYQLSGTVYLGGDPLPQTELTVYDGDNVLVQSATTNGAGGYAMEVGDGTYHLIISPPAELGLSDTLIEDVVIAQQDLLYHFVLLRPEVVLEGVVRSSSGIPVAGVQLAIYNEHSGQNAGYLMTGPGGTYSFPISEGDYRIVAFGEGKLSNIPLPDLWKIEPIAKDLALYSSRALDLNIPDVQLTGQVTGVNGESVANVAMAILESRSEDGSRYYLHYSGNSLLGDANGRYSFTVFDRARYDIGLYPPLTSGYANTVVKDNRVAGDTAIDFVLNDAAYLSGRVLTPGGLAVRGVELMVIEIASHSFAGRTTTDNDGGYIFPLRPGEYRIFAGGDGRNSNLKLPRHWEVSPLADRIILNEDRSLDLLLPVVRLSGVITDAHGVPQPNISLEFSASWEAQGASFVSNVDRNHVVSNSQGEFDLYALAYDDYVVNLLPTNNSQYVATQYTRVALPQDTVRNFSLSGASVLYGRVSTPWGEPVAGVTLNALDQDTLSTMASGKTAADGSYRLNLAPGTYKIDVWSNTNTDLPVMPQSWAIQPLLKDVAISGVHERNIVLPLVQVSGRVFDAAGRPVGGAKVRFKGAWLGSGGEVITVNNSIYNDTGYFTADANGFYTVMVFAHDNYTVELSPPAGRDLLMEVFEAIDASESSTYDLAFPQAYVLTGEVKDNRGRNVAGVNLEFYNTDYHFTVYRATTNEQGQYHVALREGHYDINVTDASAPSNIPLPDRFYMAPIVTSHPVREDSILDLTLPLASLRGRAIDSNGVPVPNVQLVIKNNWLQNGVSFSVYAYSNRFKTDAQGEYEIALFPYANYSEHILPPANSGFVAARIDGFKLERDSLQDIILSLPDKNPPLIVAGPHVTQITDTTALVQWQTNEVTSGGVAFGADGQLGLWQGGSASHRMHAVTLSGLAPNTTFYLRVLSDDYNHNGPVGSAIVSFTTLPLADTDAPLILEGPAITAITENSAVLRWVTSEPALSTLRFGPTVVTESPSYQDLTQELAIEIVNTHHEKTLQNLQADTLYTVQVEARDLAGNGSAPSSLRSFYTLAAVDKTPPMIIAGPMITDISSNSAIVSWETDEPATSGVSYNDGTAHGVLTDNELATHHSVRLSQLTPGTLYQVTVSSVDVSGNGPTLSDPEQFTTATQTDTQPPLIIEGPEIINITHQSVVIRWRTDAAADSVIEYGLSEEALLSEEARSALVWTHNLPITGLTPDTTYYFRVSSADADGNRSAASAVYSFTTDRKQSCAQPTITKAPRIIQLSDTAATLYWKTDVAADSVVHYGVGDLRLRKEMQANDTQHQVTLTGLKPDKQYQFKVASHAAQCAEPVESAIGTFTTKGAADSQAPVIQGDIKVTVLDNATVEISWATDEIAACSIQYNKTGNALTKSAGIITQTTDHKLTLTHLSAGENYSFKVVAQDIHGNSYESAAMQFNTRQDSVHPASSEENADQTQGGGVLDGGALVLLIFYILLSAHRRRLV